ncbi:MAG: molecular chaperone [Candidatus Methylomirabilales bacterium]
MEAYRAFLSQFLSLAFSYPEEKVFQTLEDSLGDLERSLQALQLSYDTASLSPALKEARKRLLDLQGEYNALFATTVKVPAWETAYELDKTARRAAELSDIEGFYRAFGLSLSAPVEPDSLVAELEFLSLLLQKQLYTLNEGDGEGAEICEEAYRKFLTDHLGRWYAVFIRRLEEISEEEYYRRIGALLKAFLEKETHGLAGEIRKVSHYKEDSIKGSTWKCDACTRGRSSTPSTLTRGARR